MATMSDRPAFPGWQMGPSPAPGMTLREWYVGLAMLGAMQMGEYTQEQVAQHALKQADATLVALVPPKMQAPPSWGVCRECGAEIESQETVVQDGRGLVCLKCWKEDSGDE